MSLYLIIDGYNLISKLPSLAKAKKKNIEFARSELFDLVQAYCDYTDVKGVIIYDGSQSNRTTEEGNPTVIFSKRGESADSIIESLVYNFSDRNKARVVTDDRAVANMITGMGASVVSATSFESELKSTLSSLKDDMKERESNLKRGIEF